jgi:seryl-tRNA synthetase
VEKALEQLAAELNAELVKVPNLSHPEAPLCKGDENNREIKRWGQPPSFSFPAKDHLQLAQELDLIDFESAARVSGPKFYYLKNEAVHLELALTRYALDTVQSEGFVPTITPDIAKEEVVEGIGFNPRGEESNIYSVEGTGTCLVGTAEITLGGYYAGKILSVEDLPVKMAGISHCFRREAGAAGQYSKGLYRVHQFSKVEMFVFCKPNQSDSMHQYLLDIEERIFQGLEIPYRVVDTCTGELGGPQVRRRGLDARPGRKGGLGRGHQRLQLYRLPGPAPGDPLQGGGTKPVRTHAQRYGRGYIPGPDCDLGEPPAARRLGTYPRKADTLYRI